MYIKSSQNITGISHLVVVVSSGFGVVAYCFLNGLCVRKKQISESKAMNDNVC